MKVSALYAFLVTMLCFSSVSAGAFVVTSPIYSGRWGNQSPLVHPRYVSNTQYAVDVYVPLNQGTRQAIRWSIYTNPYSDEGYKAQVVGIYNSCSTANAGQTVILRVFNASNQKVGEMAYSHLHDVQVGLWQWYHWYSIPLLGYSKRWAYSSCYAVNADNATHVHMEWGAWAPYGATTTGYDAYQPIAFSMGMISN